MKFPFSISCLLFWRLSSDHSIYHNYTSTSSFHLKQCEFQIPRFQPDTYLYGSSQQNKFLLYFEISKFQNLELVGTVVSSHATITSIFLSARTNWTVCGGRNRPSHSSFVLLAATKVTADRWLLVATTLRRTVISPGRIRVSCDPLLFGAIYDRC